MWVSLVGIIIVIAAHFTDLYYYYDEAHAYHRGSLFMLSFAVPVVTVVLIASVVIQYRRCFSTKIFLSLLLFLFGPVAAAVVQVFAYGLSLLNIAIVITSILIYIFAYLDINEKVNRANSIKIEYLEEQRKLSQRLFEQTATALANSIDAKDEYTRGHSLRVAEYSEKIARHIGKSEEECRKIFYTALLHDVGKIGIADSIITKNGRLTDEEYQTIKQHPVIGDQILSSIHDYPYLGVGAHYHHERYDGKGYPDGLKGEDIPEVARIISVADAYDAMTSNRSYRSAIPQQIVREEIVKNSGTQFDPKMARVMQYLIDIDNKYLMQERKAVTEVIDDGTLTCDEFGSEVSDGILLSAHAVKVKFRYEPGEGYSGEEMQPSIILFDSLDSHYHRDEKSARELFYSEYAVIRLDGKIKEGEVRKTEVRKSILKDAGKASDGRSRLYEVEAVRVRDHAVIRINNGQERINVTVAFPDCTRYSYIGLSGEHCTIDSVKIEHADRETAASEIARIAPEICYIADNEGDIPNVQVDSFRSEASEGIKITDGLKISFHSMSLPTARLIWHCPYMVLFWSDNGKVKDKNCREYGLVRLDGEYWDGVGVKNEMTMLKKDNFAGWESWKKTNKEGIDVSVTFKRQKNRITVTTENLGLFIENTTILPEEARDVYVALSGDQCAITNIRIENQRV
ncbi:MAG: HD-GYP domain-containing protein [Lachnospiraceae bacterium]|nr:HD-GYP domain-containing protein [Lachnospiraceae bacterium]